MKLKLILTIFLILCLLVGCGGNEETPTVVTTEPTQTQEPTATQAPVPVFQTALTLEAGTAALDPSAFLMNSTDPVPTIIEGPSAEQLSIIGTYPVVLECRGRFYNASVQVVDTTAPEGTVQDLTCTESIPEASAFLLEIKDATEVTVRYEGEPILANGVQMVILVLEDSGKNVTKLEAYLTLDLDVEPPQILGVSELLVDQGNALSYRSGITVTDDRDPTPKLSVDSSQVDLSTPGTYTVIYTAVDAAGNTTEVSTTVTVREMKSNYTPLETIYEKLDKLLDDIIDDDMTTREQLKAIDNWFWRNCTYVSKSDKSDLHQAAYVMMTKHRGDCYNYHGLTRLMLDRLGIPNIDVKKVKNYEGDSNHFWSMVSLDGGETWYHYDTSPRVDPSTGARVHVFLYTDAELDAFSARYRNCYNRDKSLYPATPEK